MIARIGKSYSFDAAHQLPNHNGKCARLHGHTYLVTLTLAGDISEEAGASDEGMVCDYGVLDGLWAEHLEPLLDHQFLNETIGDECGGPTTAENIAAWIGWKVYTLLGAADTEARLVTVEVRETPKTFARVENAMEWPAP